jgi:hypothetical protein
MRIRPRTVARIALSGFGKPPKKKKGLLGRHLDDRMAHARAVAKSKHLDTDTKLSYLKAQRQMLTLFNCFLWGGFAGLLIGALSRSLIVGIIGGAVVGVSVWILLEKVGGGIESRDSSKQQTTSVKGSWKGSFVQDASGEESEDASTDDEYTVSLPPWQY